MTDDHLALDLDALVSERRRCGDLDTGLTNTDPERVWLTCSCSARIERPVASIDAWSANGVA